MRSFRDHSFGEFKTNKRIGGINKLLNDIFVSLTTVNSGTKRDWKLMHRYVFHHIFLENGWKSVVGVVCQPHTCTR